MSDTKAERLAAIRAANAAKAAAEPAPATGETLPLSPAVIAPLAPTPIPQPATPIAAASARPVATPLAARPAQMGEAGGTPDLDQLPPAMSFLSLVMLLLAVVAGALGAIAIIPTWLPGLASSLSGEAPKAYWYLARSSAMVAYGLTWLAMVFGLLITSKTARLWPGGPVAFDLHQHTSLLGLAFGLFHALILLGDRYVAATPAQIFVPFAYSAYRPLWVGLGQIALYAMTLVGLSFYVKAWLGRRAWRVIHFLSFALFGLALAHGIFSGTDSGSTWAAMLYWGTGGSVLFLTFYRFGLAALAPLGKTRPALR